MKNTGLQFSPSEYDAIHRFDGQWALLDDTVTHHVRIRQKKLRSLEACRKTITEANDTISRCQRILKKRYKNDMENRSRAARKLRALIQRQTEIRETALSALPWLCIEAPFTINRRGYLLAAEIKRRSGK